MTRKLRIGIPHGDINAIGYELIFKTFNCEEIFEQCTPIVYGTPKAAAYHRNALGMQPLFTIINRVEEVKDGKLNILTTIDDDLRFELGKPTGEAEKMAKTALDKALADLQEGHVDLLVLTPSGLIDGQTQEDYIARQLQQADNSLLILVGEQMKVALATHHLPIEKVADAIDEARLAGKIEQFIRSLRRDFRVGKPRIAVLSLNTAETNSNVDGAKVTPVVQQLREKNINAYGPFNPEDFFANRQYQAFDGVLALYDAQATIPFSCLNAEKGVYLLAGMNHVVAFPQVTDRYENVGKGLADEAAFRKAVFTAIDVYRHQGVYDEAYANPLPKLYREKRDESEKVRFNIPKKHEAAEENGTDN